MAQLHSLGTGDLSQLNYNKSNGAVQARKIKQKQQATENADVRNKAASTKKHKSKALLSLTHEKLDQLQNNKTYRICWWF